MIGAVLVGICCALLCYVAWVLICYKWDPLLHIPGVPNHIRTFPFGPPLLPGESLWTRWARLRETYGRIYRFYTLFGTRWISISDPPILRHILVSNARNFVRGPLTGASAFINMVGETSMLITDGDMHRKHRSLVSPAFRPSLLRKLHEGMRNAVQSQMEHWDGLLKDRSGGVEVEIRQEMSRVTLSIIGSCGFGFDFDCIGKEDSPLALAMEQVVAMGKPIQLWHFLPFSSYLPLGRVAEMWTGIRQLQSQFRAMVQSKRQQEVPSDDLLSTILKTEENGEVLNDEEVRDEMMSMILAGHETTSLTLSFALFMLCKHPSIQAECRAEANRVLGSKDMKSISHEMIDSLDLIKGVIYEVLRLFPPVPAFPRTSLGPETLGGYEFPAGTHFGIHIGAMHRLPEIWEDPDAFKPHRFLQSDVPWDAWMPFSEGPHKCIGYKFALNELALVLGLLLNRYTFGHSPRTTQLQIQVFVTLRPSHPIYMRLRKNDHSDEHSVC